MVKGNGKAIAFGNGGGLNKLLLDTLSDFLSRLLLQDYEVAADLCACILAEHSRWQADSRNKSAVLHQITADGFVLRAVQSALRGNESQKSSFLDAVQTFHEEIVVDGSCGFPFENILSFAVFTVIDHEVPKGDIAGYKVILVFLLQWSNGFKGLVLYDDVPLPIGM